MNQYKKVQVKIDDNVCVCERERKRLRKKAEVKLPDNERHRRLEAQYWPSESTHSASILAIVRTFSSSLSLSSSFKTGQVQERETF